MGIPVINFTPSKGNDKHTRVNSVAPLFESGTIWAPTHKEFAQEVIEECAAFPYGDHDDLVDSMTQAVMRYCGGIAPGKFADILILDDIKKIKINSVLLGGETVVSNGRITQKIKKPKVPKWITSTVKLSKFLENDFYIKSSKAHENVNVINMKTEIVTEKIQEDLKTNNGNLSPSLEKDIWKVAAFDRTYGTKKHTVGFLKNFGAEIGAFASSWSFHENDLIVIGSNEKDMATACNKLSKTQGGMVVVKNGKTLALMPFQIAGIISPNPIETVSKQFSKINSSIIDSGCKFRKPHLIPVFLPFLALPDIRILYSGIVDVKKREYIDPINT